MHATPLRLLCDCFGFSLTWKRSVLVQKRSCKPCIFHSSEQTCSLCNQFGNHGKLIMTFVSFLARPCTLRDSFPSRLLDERRRKETSGQRFPLVSHRAEGEAGTLCLARYRLSFDGICFPSFNARFNLLPVHHLHVYVVTLIKCSRSLKGISF